MPKRKMPKNCKKGGSSVYPQDPGYVGVGGYGAADYATDVYGNASQQQAAVIGDNKIAMKMVAGQCGGQSRNGYSGGRKMSLKNLFKMRSTLGKSAKRRKSYGKKTRRNRHKR